MKTKIIILALILGLLLSPKMGTACSVLYYVDAKTGNIYIVNNEDYFLNTDAYLQIEPRSKKKLARLWYGWDDFAQGGINEKGLFFDAAVTPIQKKIKGFANPKHNLGDQLLAHCATVEEAIAFLEKEKIALDRSHIMFGDKSGKAVVVEWVNGERILHWISNNRLIMTNYLFSKPEAGNFPCRRYESINARLTGLEASKKEINLLAVGNTVGQAVQTPIEIEDGRYVGTLYSSFINLKEGQFVLSYKLSNTNVIKLDLRNEFSRKKRYKMGFKD